MAAKSHSSSQTKTAAKMNGKIDSIWYASSEDGAKKAETSASSSSSSLSLHIAAYEDDDAYPLGQNGSFGRILEDIKKSFLDKEVGGFEFPRQERDQDNPQEHKSSQKHDEPNAMLQDHPSVDQEEKPPQNADINLSSAKKKKTGKCPTAKAAQAELDNGDQGPLKPVEPGVVRALKKKKPSSAAAPAPVPQDEEEDEGKTVQEDIGGWNYDNDFKEQLGIRHQYVDSIFEEMHKNLYKHHGVGYIKIKDSRDGQKDFKRIINFKDPHDDSDCQLRILLLPIFFEDLQRDIRHFVLGVFDLNDMVSYYLDSIHERPIFTFYDYQSSLEMYFTNIREDGINVQFRLKSPQVCNKLVNKQERNKFCGIHVLRMAEELFLFGKPSRIWPFKIVLEKQRFDQIMKEIQEGDVIWPPTIQRLCRNNWWTLFNVYLRNRL